MVKQRVQIIPLNNITDKVQISSYTLEANTKKPIFTSDFTERQAQIKVAHNRQTWQHCLSHKGQTMQTRQGLSPLSLHFNLHAITFQFQVQQVVNFCCRNVNDMKDCSFSYECKTRQIFSSHVPHGKMVACASERERRREAKRGSRVNLYW